MVSVLSTFWYYNGTFYGQEAIIGDPSVLSYGDYMQVDADHFAIWDKYCKQMKLPSRIPYDSISRGRVLFHIPTHRFIIVGSKAIVENKEVQDKAIGYFGLPANTEFRWDEHYR